MLPAEIFETGKVP